MTLSEPTSEIFGPYRLFRLLGRGGMAEVWSGAEGRRAVALKRILPHLCDDFAVVEMFLSEARLAKLLRHPNIVGTYDAGIIQSRPFIAMELVDGVDLRRLCFGAPGLLPIPFCVSVIGGVCDALEYVHSLRDGEGHPLGLIHRDISHSNVMLTRDGGAVKLLDFGVAKARSIGGLQRTQTGELKGKLGYMAPELLRGNPYDHRADLFSVGVLLHELLTRQRLFVGENESAVLLANLGCKVSPPSQQRGEIPAALDAVVMRALAADPARRYGSAGEMLRELMATGLARGWRREDTMAVMAERAPPGAVVTPAPLRLPAETRGTARVPWHRRRSVVAAGAALLALAGVLLVTRRPAPPARQTIPRAVALPDPWAARPRLDAITSEELTLRLPPPVAAPAPTEPPPPAAPTPHAPPPPRGAARAEKPTDAHRGKKHRRDAGELTGHDLVNPLAR